MNRWGGYGQQDWMQQQRPSFPAMAGNQPPMMQPMGPQMSGPLPAMQMQAPAMSGQLPPMQSGGLAGLAQGYRNRFNQQPQGPHGFRYEKY